jgi:enoyl-CoA hydratase
MIELEPSDGGPSLLRLARPPVNALNRSLVEAITNAVAQTIEQRAPAIVLTGQGSCFSAGIDTKLTGTATREEQVASILAINAMVHTIYSAPIPVVAAINGHALGGGLVIALACDLRVASRGAHKLGLNEVAAGVPFPAGPLRVVSAELDPSVLRDLCLTGRIVEPHEARELRVLDELLEPAELLTRAFELARQLASYGAYEVVKAQIRSTVATELSQIVATGEDPMVSGWLRG